MPLSRPRRRVLAVASTVAALALALSACASGPSSGAENISIVGFSTPKPAYDALAAAFQATDAGKGVTFSSSYGPSGSQSKAVAAGQQADYVAFSLGSDMLKLVPDFVDPGWDSGPAKGIVSSSVVALVVRKGNPLHITSWDDLTKAGVKIVTPDPASSGSAKWNLLAAYEHVIQDGGTADQAAAYLTSFFRNVVSKPDSGANALQTFLSGTGDVLVSYENEAVYARQAGEDIDYLVPDDSLRIENPGAVTKTASPAAKNFLDFVESDAGQKIFASKGFRPVNGVDPGTVAGANTPDNPFPPVKHLLTIADLGGWSTVNTEFFDPDNGIATKIEESVG